MKKILLLILISVTCKAQTYQVGHLSKTFTDASRSNRSITTEIYYPATTAGNNVAVAAGQFPIIIFGHGFVMAYSAYNSVWDSIVPHGYIIVFPTTEGNFSPSHLEFGKDLAFLVGAMKAEGTNVSSPFFGATSSLSTSSVMGHSMGGGSSFLAVQYDSSITTQISLAAANTTPSSISAAAGITIPSLVISGANDCVAPPAQHQVPMYDSLASVCKTFISITGGSHCQFANYNVNCYFGEGTCQPQATITPALQQTILIDVLIPWLDFHLKGDCQAATQFQNLISSGNGITSQQNCALACLGIKEKDEVSQFSIFPNPVSTEAMISADHVLTDANLTVTNSVGQIVRTERVSGKTFQFNRSGLTAGLYFIQIAEKDKIHAKGKILITD